MHRLRAFQRSMDSDIESEDDRNVARRVEESHDDEDLVSALQQDLEGNPQVVPSFAAHEVHPLGNCNAATLVDPMVSRRVVLVPQSGILQSIMERWTQESSPAIRATVPADEPRVFPIEGVEREVPQGVTVVHLADSEDMSDSASAQAVHQKTQIPRRRTLRLMWADGAQESHRDARNAECLVRDLAARVGPKVAGAQIPTAVRSQRWSPLNVSIIWGAAGQEQSTPVVG